MNIFAESNTKLLVQALLHLQDEAQCQQFLDDLLTAKEIQSISQRLAVAQMLLKNSTFAQIVAETGASTATIGRVNRCIQYGNGGYANVLRAQTQEDHTP